MFGVFLTVMNFGHFPWVMGVIICEIELFRELLNVKVKENPGMPLQRVIGWSIFAWALYFTSAPMLLERCMKGCSATYVPIVRILSNNHQWISYGGYAMLLCLHTLSLKKNYYRKQVSRLAWSVLASAMVCMQCRAFFDNILAGLFWFYVPATLVVCNDSFAYFGGQAFGKKLIKLKFLPQLSPKKTWEGFVVGFIVTCIWGFYFSGYVVRHASVFNCWKPKLLICPYGQPDCSPIEYFVDREYHLPSWLGGFVVTALPVQWHMLYLSAFASLVAPFGGFFASGIKRAYNIKDFDSFIPGHGGLMDRLDCHIVMGMAVKVHYTTFVRPFATTVASILASVTKLPDLDQLDVYNKLSEKLMSRGLLG